MIWFGRLPGFPLPPRSHGRGILSDRARMQQALEWVAARAPHLSGAALVEALAFTGWVDQATAQRLLPEFRHFDADRFFAEKLRSISFRGSSAAPEFRLRVARVVEELAGTAALGELGGEEAIRFRHEEREGVLLAYPEVAFSLGGNTGRAVAAAIEEMPDVLVLIARNFSDATPAQLAGMLSGTGIPGTLVTVNLLLGMRAVALRYQPPTTRVLQLLGTGRPLRSADVATLGNRGG